jgi:hypothetical protein
MYQLGAGVGSVALSWLLHQDKVATLQAAEGQERNPLAPKIPQLRARAKSIIFFVMDGGPSQVDTFDPKPILSKYHGKVFQREDAKSSQVRGARYFVRSPFQFRKYGECGMDVSELFRETAEHVDDMAFVRSVYAESDNHPAALFQYNTGFPVQGNPSIGSWVVYGLGTTNQDLPAFVVLRDGMPFGGTSCWGNGYLPALYQGTQFRGGDHPVLNLSPPAGVSRQHQQANLELIQQLNRKHSARHPEQSALEAHIAAYELAFRMQAEIPEAVDLASEPESIQKLYGLDNEETKAFGGRCLLARRMVERGVRFVQVWSGGWDSHTNVVNGHANAAKGVDRPLAGLLQDLKQRGLLEETLVVWGGEFGRTVDTTEAAWNKNEPGRDHNPRAMTMWFAGGGVKGGSIVGATDEVGENAAEKRFHLRDVHATLLHLIGLDQHELTYYHGGRFKHLTTNLVDGGGGEIIDDILV